MNPLTRYVTPILKGMATTFRHIFKRTVTVQYPEEPVSLQPRFRGRQVLLRYDNGLERCIGCQLCAAACPSDAIYIESAENTDADRRSPGERYAKVYDIHMMRCIFCGFCEEACPVDAVVLRHDFELASYDREGFIYHKDDLLVPGPDEGSAR